ncbi:hypothetical protein [Candidatus Tisiphia endosymbiont of Hybos culiciformis]|uniref:hypothetical protein n=1 Tax=Candidatus Tisiphia endosymbiont of Hybos culiciformis TaxID=3139331 RepID=UPI003CCAB29C
MLVGRKILNHTLCSCEEDRRSTKQSIKVTKNGLLRRLTPPRNDARGLKNPFGLPIVPNAYKQI